MDGFRIGKLNQKDAVILHLLELHKLGFFAGLSTALSEEVTMMLMHNSARSEKFQMMADSNMAIIKWLIQVDQEAATELERRASESERANK